MKMADPTTPESGLQLGKAVQIGIVVPDLERATTALSSLFGIGPFHFIEWPNRPDSKYWYRGREQHIRIRQAFASVGPLELELIQPLEGEHNDYYRFLESTGGGIHHVLFEIDKLDSATELLERRGVRVLQAGTGIRLGTRWALLDTKALVGFRVELRHLAEGCDGTSIPPELMRSAGMR